MIFIFGGAVSVLCALAIILETGELVHVVSQRPVIMNIAHGGFKGSVAHEALNDLGVACALVDPGAEGVAEDVGGDGFVDASAFGGFVDGKRLVVGALTRDLAELAGENPRGLLGLLVAPLQQQSHGSGAQGDCGGAGFILGRAAKAAANGQGRLIFEDEIGPGEAVDFSPA